LPSIGSEITFVARGSSSGIDSHSWLEPYFSQVSHEYWGSFVPIPTKETEAMTIRPLFDRILVKRVAEQQKTAGGLHIPDSAKEKPLEAMIVAVGSGKVQEDGLRRAPMVKTGDKVLLAKYSGSEIVIDGVEHLILREDDVLAVIE